MTTPHDVTATDGSPLGVTSPAGFRAAGVTAGLKRSGRSDLAVVHNVGPRHDAAVVLTSNRVAAAPVHLTRQAVADGVLRAIVLNSGGANACTGEAGMADARAMAQATATALDLAADDVAVCSTGLIGTRLPMDLVSAGITDACRTLSEDGGADAARAIMTTDTRAKQAGHRAAAGWTIGAMAKGAGMLAPGLATMLVVITTDAVVPAEIGQRALAEATRVTFDRLDSDGCMSTNDTVALLASGASGEEPPESEFTAALTAVCHDLAQQLLSDAEGASHDIAVTVRGAISEDEAVVVARSVARSNLLKCAVFGNDPNWGRVLASVGTTDATFDPDQLDVSFNGVKVCRGGAIGEDRSLVDLSPRAVTIDIELYAGDASATVWTNDLTYDYVKENAEYST